MKKKYLITKYFGETQSLSFNITKTLNLKTLNKSQVDIDKFEKHISIKKNTKHFEKLFQKVFVLKYPVV